MLTGIILPLLSLFFPLLPHQQAAQPPAPKPDESAKAVGLIKSAIAARGGSAYLDVKTVVSKGQFSQFQKGTPGIPQPFVDYIVYPDRERTEFGKGGHRFVQSNVGNTGWTYDAESKLVKDQDEAAIKTYTQGVRYDLDNLLRRGWKSSDAKLTFLRLREVLRSTFAEGVRIDYSDGGSETIYFAQQTHLPMMTEFKTITENGPRDDQVRYYQWIDFDGVKCPKIVDNYQAGVQSSRVYYDTYEFNVDVPNDLFEKPANPKDVK